MVWRPFADIIEQTVIEVREFRTDFGCFHPFAHGRIAVEILPELPESFAPAILSLKSIQAKVGVKIAINIQMVIQIVGDQRRILMVNYFLKCLKDLLLLFFGKGVHQNLRPSVQSS